MEYLLAESKREFKQRDKNYDGIMIFFSGHGDKNNLLLSDYNGKDNGIYDRSEFISYFNGKRIRNKTSSSIKLYFLDSCRGSQLAQVIPLSSSISVPVGASQKGQYIHPEVNRGILFSNPDSYQSYEIVYDKYSDDIDWNR